MEYLTCSNFSVPSIHKRNVFIKSLSINLLTISILAIQNNSIVRLCGIIPHGICGLLYWQEKNHTYKRVILSFIDRIVSLNSLLIHGYYFNYNFQYVLIGISLFCFYLEYIFPDNWFILHCILHITYAIAVISTYKLGNI